MVNMLVGAFLGTIVVLLLISIAITGLCLCSYLIWTSVSSLLGPTPDFPLDTFNILCGSVVLLILIAMFNGIFDLGV